MSDGGGTVAVLGHLADLERVTGRPAALLHAAVEQDTVAAVARCLRGRDARADLDLVLVTLGGLLAPARKLALLLRRRAGRLRVLVPGVARSAGTLVALAADEIVFGAVGELGPLDAQLAADGRPQAGPAALSAEDVRRFPELAAEWFGVPPGDGARLLELVCGHVFPPSLVSLWRQDRTVTRTAVELLERQLAGSSEEERRKVARRLVEGFSGHADGVLLEDAVTAGLRARAARDDEDDCLTALAAAAEALCGDGPPGGDGPPAAGPPPGTPEAARGRVLGVVAAAGRVARHLGVSYPDGQHGVGWVLDGGTGAGR